MKDKEKSRGDQLREALCYDKKNGYDRVNREELEAMEAYCTGYKQFLDAGKTERECVDRAVALAEAAGFREYKRGMDLKAGDKTFVMINGCGATTMMEMLVLFKDTVEFLKARDIEVVASMVGEILTVQEAGGFQMNIAKWDEEMLRLWNTPCRTPAFSKE